MKTKNIQHTVFLHATPKEVYDALMNAKKHAQFTGEPARIRAKAGAAFSCYGGYINGTTLELEPARHIVQAWRSRGWPPGHYSVVTFQLANRPAAGRNYDSPNWVCPPAITPGKTEAGGLIIGNRSNDFLKSEIRLAPCVFLIAAIMLCNMMRLESRIANPS